jgi:hypothetical protein
MNRRGRGLGAVNVWAATLILAAVLDLNRSVATSRRSK